MKRLSIGLVMLFTIALVLSACGSSSNELINVEVSEVTRSIFYAPQYVAVTEGFFKEEGLAVEITTAWGGDKAMTALISDGADIALVGSETSIYVYQQGSDDIVVNFAQLTQTDGTFLVAKDPQPDFKWDDLKGTVFLGQRVGGMPQMVGEYVLKSHRIDPHNDLELIQNIDFANIPNAFASGTGKYVQLFEPQASIFEKQGLGHVIASFGTESGNLPYTVFMAKESYIKDNPELIQKFTNAVYKAQQWVYEQPADVVAQSIAPYFEDTELDIITSVVERYRSQESFDKNPVLSEAEWNLLQDIIEEAGELEKRVDYSVLVDTSFAQKAMK
jgi:NitT/TauT family transport system substrate-binding protein